MAEQTTQNLFANLGIDPRSQEEILAAKSQQQILDAIADREGQERFAGQHALEKSGKTAGTLIARAFGGKPKLSPTEQANVDMQDAAKKAIAEKMANNPEFAAEVKENPELLGIESIHQMANAAFAQGNTQIGSQLALEAGKQKIQYQTQKLELEKLGDEVEKGKQDIQIAGNAEKRKLGETTSVVAPNEDGVFDLENLEEQIIPATFDVATSSFVTAEGDQIDKFITLEEAIALRELALEAMEDKGAMTIAELPEEDRVRLFFAAVGQSERAGLRANIGALRTQDQIMNRVADMFQEFTAKGHDPSAFLDTAGKITAFSTGIASTMKALGGTFNAAIAEADGTVVANGINDKRFKESYSEEIAAIQMPEALQGPGDFAAEYQSSIIQLAYAVARSNEPGARQLSDTDFRNALKEIGAAAADPERLRRVILANFARKAEGLQKNLQTIDEIGVSLHLKERQGLSLIAGTGGYDVFINQIGDTAERFTRMERSTKAMRESAALTDAGIGMPVVPSEEEKDKSQSTLDFYLRK